MIFYNVHGTRCLLKNINWVKHEMVSWQTRKTNISNNMFFMAQEQRACEGTSMRACEGLSMRGCEHARASGFLGSRISLAAREMTHGEDDSDTIATTIADGSDTITTTIRDEGTSSMSSLLGLEDAIKSPKKDIERSPKIEKFWFPKIEKSPENASPRSRSPSVSHEKQKMQSIDIDRFFAEEVNYILLWQYGCNYSWLRTAHVTVQGQGNFEQIVLEKEKLILDMALHDRDFKIGITCDPIQRWTLPGGPYCYDWDFMMLLYAATNSEKEAPESSGSLEKRLIDKMCTLTQCKNKANTGGLSPTVGRPHWCYCVFRQRQCESGDYISIADTLRGDKIVSWKGLLR